jgi:biopolymer transport protein ExbD
VTDPVWPLAAVLFGLIVFFLGRLSFHLPAHVEAASTSGSALAPSSAPIVVRVTSAGTIHWKRQRLELASVRETVIEARSRMPVAPVILLSDPSTTASLLARVLDEIRLSGAPDIRVAVQEGGGLDDE